MSYYRDTYLKSEEWRTLRLTKLAITDAKCHFCHHQSWSNDVHHVKYKPSLKDTKMRHLRVLCRECHDLVHDFLKKFPAINESQRTRDRWRVTEQHVRRHLGHKISFARDPSEYHLSANPVKPVNMHLLADGDPRKIAPAHNSLTNHQ